MKAQCDMVEGCVRPVTYIGEKGYVYCAECVVHRKGWERCRKMRKWELDMINSGKPLPSYKPGRKPVSAPGEANTATESL